MLHEFGIWIFLILNLDSTSKCFVKQMHSFDNQFQGNLMSCYWVGCSKMSKPFMILGFYDAIINIF
jgi:hypothetical protein